LRKAHECNHGENCEYNKFLHLNEI
jgi:hypothetical protein